MNDTTVKEKLIFALASMTQEQFALFLLKLNEIIGDQETT